MFVLSDLNVASVFSMRVTGRASAKVQTALAFLNQSYVEHSRKRYPGVCDLSSANVRKTGCTYLAHQKNVFEGAMVDF